MDFAVGLNDSFSAVRPTSASSNDERMKDEG